ncbi:MAG: Asp-tRNA(Asn)/Glu-tRNA(Gln) amidotransferase subunit GatC [Patescibacteria group bacterium]
MAEINKKSLEHLAELARLELSEKESEKFLGDLKNILEHFQELQEVNTDNVQPMTGGTFLKNVFREDEDQPSGFKNPHKITEQFPDKEKGYLKVPPVFE